MQYCELIKSEFGSLDWELAFEKTCFSYLLGEVAMLIPDWLSWGKLLC